MKPKFWRVYYWLMSLVPLLVMDFLVFSFQGSKEEKIFKVMLFFILPISVGAVASSWCLLNSTKWYSRYTAAVTFSIYVFIILLLCIINIGIFDH